MDHGVMQYAKQSNDGTSANVNGIGDTHPNQSNDNLPVQGFEIVNSEPGKVNTLLPVLDCRSGLSPVRGDMSGAVTYRVKPGESWHHKQRHRQDAGLKRNSDICDMTMYRDPPLPPPDTGPWVGPGTGELTPATSSRSIRLCGVALGAPLTTSQDANPFRRHTLPRKARLSSAPPRPPGDSSPTPPPPVPPAQISAPSSPKVGSRPPVAFFPHQQHPGPPSEAQCSVSGTTTPINISTVSLPSQDSECTTPTESGTAYDTPSPGSSAASTPSEGSAYVTAAEVIIHDANENMVNRTNRNNCDLLTINNKQNIVNGLPEVDKKDSIINNNERTIIEQVKVPSVYIDKENIPESSLNALISEPISPEPPPTELSTAAPTASSTTPTQQTTLPQIPIKPESLPQIATTPTDTTPISNAPASTESASTTKTDSSPISTAPVTVTTVAATTRDSDKDCILISKKHSIYSHLPQSVLESTINTLESEQSVAVKCIHESSSNLCPLVTISDVATHKEVAILPAPDITLHSADVNKVSISPTAPPRLSRKSSASSLRTSNSDFGKSMETMRSPTPSDLERRPSFNKAPTPFSVGKSSTLPRTDMSASLTPEASVTLLSLYSSDKAKSASSLLSSENTSTKQDSGISLELFVSGTISNKSDIKVDKCYKDNSDFKNAGKHVLSVNETSKSSNKAKSASSLISVEDNIKRQVRERSPLEMFAAGTLPNEQHETKSEVHTPNQISKLNTSSKSNNLQKFMSNISNIQTINNEDELPSAIIQNIECISGEQMLVDIAVAHDSAHSNSAIVVPSSGGGSAKGSSSSSSTSGTIPTTTRCNQDDLVTAPQSHAIVLECTRSLEQTNTIATKTNTSDATQIPTDTSPECRETAAVDAAAAVAASITPCGGGTEVQNMATAATASGGSISIPQAAKDQSGYKDASAEAAKDDGAQKSLLTEKQNTEEHGPSNTKDASADSSRNRPDCKGHVLPQCATASDNDLKTTQNDQQHNVLVLNEIKSTQDSEVINTVRQVEVHPVSVNVASSNLVSHSKPDVLTDCDIIDLNVSQCDYQNDGIIQLNKNVINYIPSESNEINAVKTIQNENDVNINIPHDKLFINEDEINIPVKDTCSAVLKAKTNNKDIDITENIENETIKDIQKSKDSTETEQSLNDSLSEGIRSIAKSASFNSKTKGATISNCAALIALTGNAPKPQSHFPMDIICQSKKLPTARQRMATTLGEPVEPAVIQRRRQSSLGHVDPTEKETHSERSRSASRIGYRHSTAFGETSSLTPFDLKQTQKSESHAKSNKDVRNMSPAPVHPKPPFVRGKSCESTDTQKKVTDNYKNTVKDNELGTKTASLSTKPPIKQIDNKLASPLPPIRAKKNINKETDESSKKVLYENKTTELSLNDNLKEVQIPLIHRLVTQNIEDLNKEKELESMSQDLEDLQREKELESMITHSETQISLPQPKKGKVEVSTHIFDSSETEAIINSNIKLESERPACVPSLVIPNGSDNIDFSKKIRLDLKHSHKNSDKNDHSTTISIPIIIETKVEEIFLQNNESGPSSLDQSQDEEIFEAALEIVDPTPAFSRSSTSIKTVIDVESSTSVTPTPELTPDINQKATTEENEEHFEDASDRLNENEKEKAENDFNSTIESHSIIDQSSRKSLSPCEQIIHLGSSQKTLEESILIEDEGSVSSGGVVTDPEMLASASASLSSASSWASTGGPVARRDYPLDEDEAETRWKALLAANDIDTESGNDGCVSEDDFDTMDEEMRRLEEKLKIFENELGDSVDPSCPSENGQTSSTSSRPLFKPEDIEGLRISPLPKVYPPPSMNKTKHYSLMSKIDMEQYGESETESEGNSDNCSDDSSDFLYVKKRLKLKPGERKCRSHYLIRPKNMNVLNSNKASFDEKTFENKMDEELRLSGIVSQNDHNDTFDEVFSDKVDILPPQEYESYEISSDNPVQLQNIQEEREETESIDQQYEDIADMREESVMFYGNEEEPLLGYMWYEDDGMTAVDFDGPEELQNYSGQGAIFFIFEDDSDECDIDEPEFVDPIDYNIVESPQIISETKYIENVKEKEKSPKQKDERTFVSAFKNSLRKASKYLGPKIDSTQKKRSRSASASRYKQGHNSEEITTKNMHLLPAPEDAPERRRSAALDDYKDYSGVYNVRSGRTRPNHGPMSDSEGPDISCSSGEYYASPALCVNTSDEDPSIAIPPPPTIPPPPLPPVPPPRWSRWEPTIEAPQSAGVEYGCWFENNQENRQENVVPAHSPEGNLNLDGNEMQFFLVGTPNDTQITIETESEVNEPMSDEEIQLGAVYGEPYIKMTGWDPENCCEYEYIETLPCVDPAGHIQQPPECTGESDEMTYSDSLPSPSHRPTSLKQLKRKQHEKAQRQEEDSQNYEEYNTTDGVPVKRERPAQEESSHGRQVSPHPKAIGDRRSWPPRVSSTVQQFYWSLPYLPWCISQVLDGHTPIDGEILIASSLYIANLTPITHPSSAYSESPISTSRDPYSVSTPPGSTEPSSASSSDSEPYWTPSRRGLDYQGHCQEIFKPIVYSVISPSSSLIYSPSTTHTWNLLTSVEPCWNPVDDTTPTATTNITATTTKDLDESKCQHYDSSGTYNTSHDSSRLDLLPCHGASITFLDWSNHTTKSPLIGMSPCYSCPLLLFTNIGDINPDIFQYDEVTEDFPPPTNVGTNQVPSHGWLIQSSSASSIGWECQFRLRYSASESEVESSGVDIDW